MQTKQHHQSTSTLLYTNMLSLYRRSCQQTGLYTVAETLEFKFLLEIKNYKQSLFTTSKTDRHLLSQKVCQRISVKETNPALHQHALAVPALMPADRPLHGGRNLKKTFSLEIKTHKGSKS